MHMHACACIHAYFILSILGRLLMGYNLILGLTLYGYPGYRVTLPCTGFTNQTVAMLDTLDWSRCDLEDCLGQWQPLSRLEYTGPSAAKVSYWGILRYGRGNVSIATGDLTIHRFEKRDEGLYTCDPTGAESVQIRLLNYGTLHPVNLSHSGDFSTVPRITQCIL